MRSGTFNNKDSSNSVTNKIIIGFGRENPSRKSSSSKNVTNVGNINDKIRNNTTFS